MMVTRWIFYCNIVIGMLISNTHSSEENYDMAADIINTNSEPMDILELRKTSNSTSDLPPIPAIIQQGKNRIEIFKPTFIVGTPFVSFESNDLPDSVSVTSKQNGVEVGTVSGKPKIPPSPAIVPTSALPMIIPTDVAGDIPMPLSRIPYPLQLPISTPISCQSCQQYVITPYFPLRFPNLVEKPVLPIVIPKPPELPPINLPKLPIPVLVQRPINPTRPICPPMTRCISTEKEVASTPNIFRDIFRKFQNLLTISNNIDITKISISNEQTVISESPMTFPTICAQEIIAERVVPNIANSDDVEVIMSPVSLSQLAHFNHYRK